MNAAALAAALAEAGHDDLAEALRSREEPPPEDMNLLMRRALHENVIRAEGRFGHDIFGRPDEPDPPTAA